MSDWERDDRLVADLRTALTPTSYLDSALAAFRVGQTHGPTSVAELAFDSACDPQPAGRIRASGSTRLLAFRADAHAIDVEVGDDELLGQLFPDDPGPVPAGTVTGQHLRGVFGETELDEVGGFALPLPPPGPIRLRAHLADLTVVTSWMLLRYPDVG